jgi:uncharacterized protein (TIGR03032 family)
VSDTQHDLASVHTSSFTELLHKAGVSVAITTYQAGKLILARAVGDVTNTHFRSFDKPMGMATDGRRLALGTDSHLWCFHNIPAAAAKQAGEQPLDALYLPRHIHVTGDVDIHEMALTGDDIWFINTRFSCLCTVSTEHSFQPRWKPDFISAYDMRDRCHLNGLAVRDGRPRYVTALGRSDEPGGWRRHKADGGLLIDMDSDRVLIDDLSMPHSPRWYRGSLWVLESGCGALCRVDAQSGARETVCELPGFTRGLDFIGDYALVGLSQVRETATFSGLPLTRKQPKRHSGVWVVDLRNGDIVAFLRFEKGVQEVFAVSILRHRMPDLVHEDRAPLRTAYVLPDEVLAQAVQPDSSWEFAEQHFERGNRLFNDGDTAAALAAWERTLELRADYLPARFNRALALSRLERFAEAREQLERVLAEEAGHVEALNSLGFVHSRLGDASRARECFAQAVALRPEYADARRNLEALDASGATPDPASDTG